MYNVSDELKAAINAEAVITTARITLLDTGVVIDGNNLCTVKITDKCYQDGIIIGTAMCKEVEIELINDNFDLSDKEFSLEVGVKLANGEYEYIPYGNYIVKEYSDSKSSNTYKIIAYDYMDKLNVEFTDSYDYSEPITLQQFYENFANFYDIEIVEQTLPNQNFLITTKPYFDGMTGREVAARIAEMFGSFAKFNRENKLQMYLQTQTTEQISRNEMNTSLTINNKFGPINVVVLRLSDIEGENVTLKDEKSIEINGEITLQIQDNPFIYTEDLRKKAIQAIFDRVKGFSYYPTKFNSKLIYFDCGDIVEVQNMNSDEYYPTMILNQTLQIPNTIKSDFSNEALTSTGVTNQYISAQTVKNRRTEYLIDKQNQTITQIIAKTTEIAGKSIYSVQVQYALSDNSTTAPTEGWSTTAPEWESGKYMWQKTVTIYGDGSAKESDATNISGANGQDGVDGAKGDTGIGVSSLETEYYLSTSDTEQTGGEWSATEPKYETGKYFWTRTKITWTDNSVTYTAPILAEGINNANQGIDNITTTEGTATGKNIHIEDSSEEPLVDIVVKGETNQATRSGKNLLKSIGSSSSNTTIDDNNITFDFSKDQDTYAYLLFNKNVGKTYTVVFDGAGMADGEQIGFTLETSNDSEIFYFKNGKNIWTKTTTRDINRFTLDDKSRANINSSITLSNIMILEGEFTEETIGDYEPYGASPSPDYPSEIENVDNVEINVVGKNLFDNNYASNYANTILSSYRFIEIQNSKPNTTYRFSNYDLEGYKKSFTGAIFMTRYPNYANGVLGAGSEPILNNSAGFSNSTIQFVTSETGKCYLGFYQTTWTEEIWKNIISYFSNAQLEEGTEATDYEPYQTQTETFPLSEGQKLYEGSYLADDGIHNKFRELSLAIADMNNAEKYPGWTNLTQLKEDYPSQNIRLDQLCNNAYCNITKVGGYIGVNTTGSGILYLATGGFGLTQTEWKEQYPDLVFNLQYELPEEEIIPYTEEQQEAWERIKELYTYKNITNITSTADLDIVYVRDNGLSDMYETKQNANKKYKEYKTQFVQTQKSLSGITDIVGEIETSLNNDYYTKEQEDVKFDDLINDVNTLGASWTEFERTKDKFEMRINTLETEGTTKVKTTTGYTFDADGFKLNRDGAETGTIIDEAAIRVIDKTASTSQDLLYAGYIKEGNANYSEYIGQTIVAAANMIVKNYLVVPNSRFENYENPTLKGKGTGVFGV